MLQSFVTNSMGLFDITNEEPEKSYHLFILGMLVFLKDSYEVKSNKENGLGRYDSMLIPLKKQNTGIIIEFKKIWPESKETLELAANKALNQIEDKHYAQELETGVFSQLLLMASLSRKGNSLLNADDLKTESRSSVISTSNVRHLRFIPIQFAAFCEHFAGNLLRMPFKFIPSALTHSNFT